MRAFVIGDVHGNPALLRGLLEDAGLVAGGYRKRTEVTVVQVGDLANCVAEDRDGDITCLDYAAKWVDVVLVGNHEHPYFGGPRFFGFWEYPEVGEKIRHLDRAGVIRPCFRSGDILVTHAGVGPQCELSDAEQAEGRINHLWRHERAHPLFDAIGYARGGAARYGGILWADRDEPKASFPQIVGHTPSPKHPLRVGRTLYLDGGGKHYGRLAGAFVEDGVVGEILVRDEAEA